MKSAKVFEPVIVIMPVLVPLENQISLYVLEPPVKVKSELLEFVALMMEVLGLKVKLVVVVKSQIVPIPVKVIVEPPKVRVLDPVPVPEKLPQETVCPLVSRVPVNAPIVIDAADAEAVIVQVPPPELALKITLSEDVGTGAPAEPPEI